MGVQGTYGLFVGVLYETGLSSSLTLQYKPDK